MHKIYDIISQSSHESGGIHPDAGNIGKELSQLNTIRNEVTKKYELENPDPLFVLALEKAKKFILELFADYGVEQIEFPEFTFIDGDQQQKMYEDLDELQEKSDFIRYKNVISLAERTNAIPIHTDVLPIDVVREIFRLVLLTMGKEVLLVKNESVKTARIGLQHVAAETAIKAKLFEHGYLAYLSNLFIDELSKHEEFSTSLARKKEVLEEFGYKPTDTMHFTNGSNVSAQHCTVLEDTDGEIKLNLELTQYAGDIFDLLLSVYNDDEKKELLALITKARTDFSLLPTVSQVIDEKWGKGTYSSFLRNTFSFDSLNTLKTTLENKKYCITLLEKFRKKVELADDLETKKRVLDEIKKELQEMDSTRYAIAKSKYYREVREMPEQRSDLFTNDDDNLVLQLTKIAQDLQNSIEGELPKYITISRSTEPIGETKLQKLEVGRPNKVQLNFMVTDAVWPYDSEKKLYFMIQSFQDTQTRIISTANSNNDDQDNIPSITFSALQKWDAITIDVTPTEPNTPIEIGYMLVNENGMPVLQGTLDMHTA